MCSEPGCNREALLLCDGPGIGGRRTCDRPLCLAHAAEVANEIHLCPFHAEKEKNHELRPTAREVKEEAEIDGRTLCKASPERCPARSCLRRVWSEDAGIRYFDFAKTKTHWKWPCRYYLPTKIGLSAAHTGARD